MTFRVVRFTITNLELSSLLFGTPIINQPQVAILGVGYIEKKPAVIETSEGDVIAVRHKNVSFFVIRSSGGGWYVRGAIPLCDKD